MTQIDELEAAQLTGGSRHPVHRRPVPHIRRQAQEHLKSWPRVHSPLPMPRLLMTPYVGCEAECEFCFTRGFPGLYRQGFEDGTLTVYTNYADHVSEQLDRLRLAPPAYISPYSDPFQPINNRYGLTERIVKECVLNGLPVEIVSRYTILDEVVAMLKHLPTVSIDSELEKPAARVQVSIDPFDREGSIPYFRDRLEDVVRIRKVGVDAVPRLSPLFPGESDFRPSVERLLEEIAARDIPHVVVEFGTVPPALYDQYVDGCESLYEQGGDGNNWWVPTADARKSMLEIIRSMCDSLIVTMGVLGAPEAQDRFGHYRHPFPWMLPIGHRPSNQSFFELIEQCPGDCLRCPEPVCGVDELQGSQRPRGISTVDWDRWGQTRQQESLLT